MKLRSLSRFAWPGLLAVLAACDGSTVEVHFAEPFPAGGADAAGFPGRQRGRYVAATDTAEALVLTADRLLQEHAEQQVSRGRWLDSLGLPRRAGEWPARGRRYRVQPLAADSFQLSWVEQDTLLTVGQEGSHLRRYRGWYYLNRSDADRPGRWQVQRLAIAGRHLIWQAPNPDTLRLRVLSPADLQEERGPHRLRFVIRPHSGRAMRQVSRTDGIWQTLGEYAK